ncbi:putative RNA interference and gene silencing protein [Leptodontidium sp. MPI-SDFR-AT-0119]|nr:putative RNA interference and gene silencing protein [Leptodontidium sp. MPI-SDFR-AT-0119]
MSGNQFQRGRGRGRGDRPPSNRGRGSHFQVASFESRGGRGTRGGFGRGGRGGPAEVEVFFHGPGEYPEHDIHVRKVENETARAVQLKSTGPQKSIREQRLPPRPGYGTQGKEVTLWANYFEIVAHKDSMLFRYSIEIIPVDTGVGRAPTSKRAKRVIELLVEEHFSEHKNSIATDYKSNLICRLELPIEEYLVRYRSEEEDEPSQNAKAYRLRLQSTGTLAVSELMDYLTSSHASTLFGSKDEIIQALNIVMGHYPKSASNIFSVGANKHFELAPAALETTSLGGGLQAIRGFFISVRSATCRILLNVQIKHAACYEEGLLGPLISAYLSHNDRNMVRLATFLKRLRVRVTHIIRKNRVSREIPRIKTITGLATPGDGHGLQYPPIVPKFAAGAKEVKFHLGSPEGQPSTSQPSKKGKKPIKEGPEPPGGGYISVFDFFQRTHGITITDPNIPVINVGTRENPSYLPPDVCVVLPGQPSGAKLTPGQTQQMIRFAVRRPAANARSIVTNAARLLGIEPPVNSTLAEFDIAVMPRLIAVPGRVLTGPNVRYKDGKPAQTRFASWNMQGVEFSTRSKLPSWTYLLISSPRAADAWRNEQELSSTLNAFQRKVRQLGIDVNDYTPSLRINLNPANVDGDIDAAIQRFLSHPTRPPPKLILAIIPHLDSSIYNRIKYVCDVKKGLLNVCTLGPKFAKANDQYYANVALKFNLKLGGRNQYLDNTKIGIIAEGKTMVVGIDVTYPTPGSASNAPSVAGIVASVDPWLGQWPADLQIQTARQEMVSGLDSMLKSRLRLWATKNKGTYPENILIYRDGVSEGQYEIACKELYPPSDSKKGLPRMSIIIVGKRYNTRFYPTTKESADPSSNPQNGTVVDRGVTEARNWDFFLQAHTALQGTARPAHYHTVLDEIFRSRKAQPPFQNAADVLEDLTHNMCYLFGRATKAVSICPAAYYADLVCERARCYLSKLFDATPGPTLAGSVVSGVGGGGGQVADPNNVRIHENVRNAMFYI